MNFRTNLASLAPWRRILCALLLVHPAAAQESSAWRAFTDAARAVHDSQAPIPEQKVLVERAVSAWAELKAEERAGEACDELACRLAIRANTLGEYDHAERLLSDVERRLIESGEDVAVRRQYCSFLLGQVCLNRGDFKQARTRLAAAEPVLARRYEPGDRNLLILRRDLGNVSLRLRDYTTAVACYERIVEAIRERSDLLVVEMLEQLGYARHFAGDRMGAFAAYEERLALALRLLPDDDLRVARARQNLGTAMMSLGDYRGAYEQNVKVLEVRMVQLPPDDPRLLGELVGQSKLLLQLGEDARAKSVILDVVARLRAVATPLTEEQAEIFAEARLHLAQLLNAEEDHAASDVEALAAREHYAATRRHGDRDLATCEMMLGANAASSGRFAEARQRLERAVEGLTASLPIEHNTVQIACSELIRACRQSGDVERAVELTRRLIDAARTSIEHAQLAARPLGQLAAIQQAGIGHALSLALDLPETDTKSQLVGMALQVSQLLRGIETRVARAASRVRRNQRAETQVIEAELIVIAERIQAMVRGRAELDEPKRAALDELVRRKEQLQGRLLPGAATVARAMPRVEDLIAALPSGSAAVATIRFARQQVTPTGVGPADSQFWLAAVVVQPGRPIRLVDLGSLNTLSELMDAVDTRRDALRAALLDPLLRALDGCRVVHLAADELLASVALDALPLASGEPVGTVLELRLVESLFDLTETWPAPTAAVASLVTVGGLDYGAVESDRLAPGVRPLAVVPPPPQLLRGREGLFPALPATSEEVAAVAASFVKRFPTGKVTQLTGRAATKLALREAVRGARFVHFATHGFGCDERPVADATEPAATVVGLSAFALCGLALSGANLPADGEGRLPGILLGEELLQFDLTDCHLAVLSVCDSATGAFSFGQGFAALHRALHAAGARFVVSTKWSIGDAAANFMMREFHLELMADPSKPHRALWAAKMRARAGGLAERDWAAFTLTGC